MYNKVDSKGFRNLVVGLNILSPLSNGTCIPYVNLDNAATTPSFYTVLKSINNFSSIYSSVHRGLGYKSILSSNMYDHGRKIVKNFVHADSEKDVVIYTKNTTDSINTLAYVLNEQKDGKNIILSTWMEHVANDLPWRDYFDVKYVEIDELGRLCLNDLENKLEKYKGKVKLVAVTGASNVTGYLNPIHEIAKLSHKHGVKILVDGAQLVPHVPFDMKPFGTAEHIDFLVFSSHKMYAPFGTGILIGPKEVFEKGNPYCKGGGAIRLVTHNRIQWEPPPEKDEAGTPNLMGIVALITSINTLQIIGMDNVYKREKELYDYAIDKIKKIPEIKLYSDPSKEDTISIIPFNFKGIHHKIMSAILSYEAGIGVRSGFFCAHPYCERLLGYSEDDMNYFFENPKALLPGMVRISFGLYNDYSDIDRLISILNEISCNKEYYLKKYSNNRSFYRISNDVK